MFRCAQSNLDRPLRELLGRYRRRFAARAPGDWQSLSGLAALTFRPGDRTADFNGKTLRPLGVASAVTLVYEPGGGRAVISGVRARQLVDATVEYGVGGRRDFQLDVLPSEGAGNLRVVRNPSLAETALQLDAVARRRIDSRCRAPIFPRVLLGFAPDRPPVFEPSEALLRTAADRLGVTVEHLSGNSPVLLERLLEQTWQDMLIGPNDPSNSTGLLLADAEYCSRPVGVLRVYEDFRQLVGVSTWNPAENVKVLRRSNPTAELLGSYGFEPASGWENAIDAETLAQLLIAFRQHLGEDADRFSDEDLYDALLEPGVPVSAVSEILPRLRKRLSDYWSECSTEADLRAAARQPDRPLLASGACCVQVVRHDADPESLLFTPDRLGRRITADWRSIDWTNRQERPNVAIGKCE